MNRAVDGHQVRTEPCDGLRGHHHERDRHRLTTYGHGGDVWGKCSCGVWAWLGSNVAPKGKRAKLRAAHAEHIEAQETC